MCVANPTADGVDDALTSCAGTSGDGGLCAQLHCVDGYHPAPDLSPHCLLGEWHDVQCSPDLCASPPVVAQALNATLAACAGMASGGTCQLLCEPGYTAAALDGLQCQAGAWVAAVAELCTPLPCDAEPEIAFAVAGVCPGTAHGAGCAFECAAGFSRSAAAQCALGAWEPGPQCVANACVEDCDVSKAMSSATTLVGLPQAELTAALEGAIAAALEALLAGAEETTVGFSEAVGGRRRTTGRDEAAGSVAGELTRWGASEGGGMRRGGNGPDSAVRNSVFLRRHRPHAVAQNKAALRGDDEGAWGSRGALAARGGAQSQQRRRLLGGDTVVDWTAEFTNFVALATAAAAFDPAGFAASLASALNANPLLANNTAIHITNASTAALVVVPQPVAGGAEEETAEATEASGNSTERRWVGRGCQHEPAPLRSTRVTPFGASQENHWRHLDASQRAAVACCTACGEQPEQGGDSTWGAAVGSGEVCCSAPAVMRPGAAEEAPECSFWPRVATLAEAEQACHTLGARLCTAEELGRNVCCGSGCNEVALVWTASRHPAQALGLAFEAYEHESHMYGNDAARLSDPAMSSSASAESWAGMVPSVSHSHLPQFLWYPDPQSLISKIRGVEADLFFFMRWRGRLLLASSGVYAFRTRSSGGSMLLVNGAPFLSDDSRHGMTTLHGQLHLARGTHRIALTLARHEGMAAGLELSWKPPGSSAWAPLSPGVLRPPAAFAPLSGGGGGKASGGGGGELLLFRQTSPTWMAPSEWLRLHGQPDSPNYSILDRLDATGCQRASGSYLFRIKWPQGGDVSLRWSQASTPGAAFLQGAGGQAVGYAVGGAALALHSFAGLIGDSTGPLTRRGHVHLPRAACWAACFGRLAMAPRHG